MQQKRCMLQAKWDSTFLGAKQVMSSDKATAISGIEQFIGELMRQDRKLTILKTLQARHESARNKSVVCRERFDASKP